VSEATFYHHCHRGDTESGWEHIGRKKERVRLGAYRKKEGESQVGNIGRKKERVRLGAYRQKEGESQVGSI
jgi:hypothetical protein